MGRQRYSLPLSLFLVKLLLDTFVPIISLPSHGVWDAKLYIADMPVPMPMPPATFDRAPTSTRCNSINAEAHWKYDDEDQDANVRTTPYARY
jgi:hypothetical protein